MVNIKREDKRLTRGYLIALVVFVFLFTFYQEGSVFAQKRRCVPTHWNEDELVHNEYKCESDKCGANIYHREYRRIRPCSRDSCDKETVCGDWHYYHGQPNLHKDLPDVNIYKTLDERMRCDPGQTDWQTTIPTFSCQEGCQVVRLIEREYRCENDNCGTRILFRERQKKKTCFGGDPDDNICERGSCGSWSLRFSLPIHYKTLDSWLKCDPGQTNWQRTVPTYRCRGVCLKKPTDPRYNEGASNVNLNIPFKVSWTDVPGFGKTARKGPISYNARIDNTNADPENTDSSGSFEFEHDVSGAGAFPVFVSLPDLDLSKEDARDGQFIIVDGEYRFIRPTPHAIRRITSCFGQRWRHWDRPPKWGFHNGIDIGHGGRMECTKRGVRFGANVCLEVQPTPGNTWIPIYASAPGRITFVGEFRGGGNTVIIDHSEHNFHLLYDGSEKETRYMHLNHFSRSAEHGQIRSGDRVTSGGEIWGTRQIGTHPTTGEPIRQNVKIRNDSIIGWMGSTGVSTGAHLHFEIRINGQAINPLELITIPDQTPWVGDVPCLEGELTARRNANVLASLPGEESPLNRRLEDYNSAMPSFSYKRETNPFSVNLKGNQFWPENCLLRRSSSHNWSAQACCNWNGTECGPSSSWSMTTSNKTEQLRQGTEAGTSSDSEMIYKLEDANLRWCEDRFEEPVVIAGEKRTVFNPPDRYEVVVEQKLPSFYLWGFGLFQRFQTHPFLRERGGSIFQTANPPLEMVPRTHAKNEDFLLFTKNDYAHYRWRARACVGEKDDPRCNKWTPTRYLKVFEELIIDTPHLIGPPDDPQEKKEISWPVSFSWAASLGANSYEFLLYEGNTRRLRKIVESAPGEGGQITRIHQLTLPKAGVNFSFKLDTLYKWKVRSCWDTQAIEKFCEKEWSIRHFRTTGRPPLLISPAADAENLLIPLRLDWELVPGARSYLLNFNGKETVVIDDHANVGHPILRQNTLYTWSVRTCNDAEGKVCGESSETRRFRTLALEPPKNLKPPSADYFSGQHSKIDLSWDKVLGAHYYEVSISCNESVVFSEIINRTERSVPLICVGDNYWTVRGCIDINCEDAGLPGQGHFVFHEGEMRRIGFVPCGLDYDSPATPSWNERDACELHHIFIMLKIILDFVFWQLMPLILVVMIVISGVIFYTSFGNPDTITKIKSIWSSVGKGLLIMFLGWTAITVIMAIMGHNIGIFGPWWQISF